MKELDRAYIGYTRHNTWEAFVSPGEPTRETHGDRYLFVWGPFSSLLIAQWVAAHTPGNHHFTDVDAAERIYHQYHPE